MQSAKLKKLKNPNPEDQKVFLTRNDKREVYWLTKNELKFLKDKYNEKRDFDDSLEESILNLIVMSYRYFQDDKYLNQQHIADILGTSLSKVKNGIYITERLSRMTLGKTFRNEPGVGYRLAENPMDLAYESLKKALRCISHLRALVILKDYTWEHIDWENLAKDDYLLHQLFTSVKNFSAYGQATLGIFEKDLRALGSEAQDFINAAAVDVRRPKFED